MCVKLLLTDSPGTELAGRIFMYGELKGASP